VPARCTCCRREPGLQADVAVVVTGVNDVVDQVPSHRAVATREALANWLRNAARRAARGLRAAAAGAPFPGLPQPLRWVAGADARRHNVALARWAGHARRRVDAWTWKCRWTAGVMASDGFHPGAGRLPLLRRGHRHAHGHARCGPHFDEAAMTRSLQGKTL
jgi:lysophospholipase L1-like esterase